jgi:hypothetical protein
MEYENNCSTASQNIEGRQKITYAQSTRNNIETPTSPINNTQRHKIKIMQKSFTKRHTISSKQAEPMSTLIKLLTAVLSKLVK